MNTKEYVKLTADGDYVPIKYMVMETTIGNTALSSYAGLKVAGHGMTTGPLYEAYKAAVLDATFNGISVPTGLTGAIGTYSVVALSTVETWRGKSFHEGPYNIG